MGTDPGSVGRDVIIAAAAVAVVELIKRIPYLKKTPTFTYPIIAAGIGGTIGIFAYPERGPIMGFLSGARDAILGIGGRSAIKNVVVKPTQKFLKGGVDK